MTKMISKSYSNNIIIGKMYSIPYVKAQKSLLTRGYTRESVSSILMITQPYRFRPCNAGRSALYPIKYMQEVLHEAER